MIQFDPMPSDPLASWVSNRNWLGDAVANASGSVNTCTGSLFESAQTRNERMESINRATVYDGSKMFWHLTQQEGVSPEDLSDVYVDMCPREWRPRDGNCQEGDDLPLRRLEISAEHHGRAGALANQVDHVVH